VLLEGSCHCQRVRFRFESRHPYPFNFCYCSICRKTGGGGFAINLGGDFTTLEVEGEEFMTIYQARLVNADGDSAESPARRHFCKVCGSALWVWDPRWQELMHPFASAIDTALPEAPERTHMMLESKAPWVPVMAGPDDKSFEQYPNESIADWHRRLGLEG